MYGKYLTGLITTLTLATFGILPVPVCAWNNTSISSTASLAVQESSGGQNGWTASGSNIESQGSLASVFAGLNLSVDVSAIPSTYITALSTNVEFPTYSVGKSMIISGTVTPETNTQGISVAWRGGIYQADSSTSVKAICSWDKLNNEINGLTIESADAGKVIYNIRSLGNNLFGCTGGTDKDTVIWNSDTSYGISTSNRIGGSGTEPYINLNSDTATVAVNAYNPENGKLTSSIQVQLSENSEIQKITFLGYDNSEKAYVIGYLKVNADSEVNLTAKIAGDGKSVEVFNKYQPGSALSASIETYKETPLVFLNFKENGKINEETAETTFIPELDENGKSFEKEIKGTLCLEDGSSVGFAGGGDISLITSYGDMLIIQP